MRSTMWVSTDSTNAPSTSGSPAPAKRNIPVVSSHHVCTPAADVAPAPLPPSACARYEQACGDPTPPCARPEPPTPRPTHRWRDGPPVRAARGSPPRHVPRRPDEAAPPAASGLDGLAPRPHRHPIASRHRVVDGAALVEHRGHRELLDPQPALLGHQLGPPRLEPLRRMAAQLVQPVTVIEHVFDCMRPTLKVQEESSGLSTRSIGARTMTA